MLDVNNCFTYTYSAGTFADYSEDVTAAAISANVLDLDAAGIVPSGGSKPLWLIVRTIDVFATIVSLGIKLITDSAVPSLDAATGLDIVIYRFALAELTANTLLINQPLPHFSYLQYLALEYEPYTEASAGSIVAYLSNSPEPAISAPEQTVEAGT